MSNLLEPLPSIIVGVFEQDYENLKVETELVQLRLKTQKRRLSKKLYRKFQLKLCWLESNIQTLYISRKHPQIGDVDRDLMVYPLILKMSTTLRYINDTLDDADKEYFRVSNMRTSDLSQNHDDNQTVYCCKPISNE